MSIVQRASSNVVTLVTSGADRCDDWGAEGRANGQADATPVGAAAPGLPRSCNTGVNSCFWNADLRLCYASK